MEQAASNLSVHLMRTPDEHGVGVLGLSHKRKSFFYAFREIICEIGGRGFVVRRFDRDELYHVRIGVLEECSCECLGYLRHGHCKHIEALMKLAEQKVI